MKTFNAEYDDRERAWKTKEIDLQRDVYIIVALEEAGKVVVRQELKDGNCPRIPIRRHKDTKEFHFRVSVVPESAKIQIFTSTKPKEIKYAYI